MEAVRPKKSKSKTSGKSQVKHTEPLKMVAIMTRCLFFVFMRKKIMFSSV